MSLLERITSRPPTQRAEAVRLYPTWKTEVDPPFGNFEEYASVGFGSNAIVFACIQVRQRFLSEIEFKYQNLGDRRLYGSPTLGLLEEPWPNGTTGDLVARMEQDASIAGNAYIHRTTSGTLQRLRPDWVSIVTDGFQPFGYRYEAPGSDPIMLPVEDVAHYAPIPDPQAPYRGMSWLSPVAKEIMSDRSMESHRNKYFQNAATPNMIVKVEQALSADDRQVIEQAMARKYVGDNAYKTMVIDRGADVQIVGNSMVDMAFADVQGVGEVRIASAAGVPPQLLGTQLGLKSSTFTNYTQAFRFFVDGTIRPLWRGMAGALERIVDVPAGSRLWYDDRFVPALQQDAQDEAAIYDANARTIGALIRSGFDPDACVDAVQNSDLSSLLGAHLGFLPTTLQPDEGDGPQVAVGGVADEDTSPSDPEVNG